MKAEDVSGDLKSVLLNREEIDGIVQDLAVRIDRDYEGKDVLLVGVLKGALMIMADLSRAMKSQVTIRFYGGIFLWVRNEILRRSADLEGPRRRSDGSSRVDRRGYRRFRSDTLLAEDELEVSGPGIRRDCDPLA